LANGFIPPDDSPSGGIFVPSDGADSSAKTMEISSKSDQTEPLAIKWTEKVASYGKNPYLCRVSLSITVD
jgi:hypothetical protein